VKPLCLIGRMILVSSLLSCAMKASQAASTQPGSSTFAVQNVSLQHEVDLALGRGAEFLRGRQSGDGSWSNPRQPAITSLALLALAKNATSSREENSFALEKGFGFVRTQVREDGGIYAEGLSNYNTAICTLALLQRGETRDAMIVERARRFLISQQTSTMALPELNGGIGYGPTGVTPKRQHPDLDNTLVSLEALRACELARATQEKEDGPSLDWNAAIAFVSRCQNLSSTNPLSWVSEHASDQGGFVYFPGFSNAGGATNPDGSQSLRSYGSMSYAGLLSFIYAELSPRDPRMVAAVDWLEKHFALDENPGLGEQGLYYYYHLMAKALAASRDTLGGSVASARPVSGSVVSVDAAASQGRIPPEWASGLALKLIQLQSGDGSWSNKNGRWMESDSVLVTAYSMLSLQLVRERL
jgi:squalene-hopene/tetraprenyl-beta-curcumene cyclase